MLFIFVASGNELLSVVVPGLTEVRRLGGFLVLDDLRNRMVEEGRVMRMRILVLECEGLASVLFVECRVGL